MREVEVPKTPETKSMADKDHAAVVRHVRVEHGWLFGEDQDHHKLHAAMHDRSQMFRPPNGFGIPNHAHHERNGG